MAKTRPLSMPMELKVSFFCATRALLQPFSQKSLTPTVSKEFPIGLYDPVEADLELFGDNRNKGIFRELLYCRRCRRAPDATLDGGGDARHHSAGAGAPRRGALAGSRQDSRVFARR